MVTGVMSKAENLARTGNVYTAEITIPDSSSDSRYFLRLYANKDFEFKSVLVVEE